MSTPWWAAFPPAETRIRCGAGRHRLRWEQGLLIAADHPDVDGERVLAAPQGGKAECVVMVHAWAAHSDDLDVLTLGPRSAADKLTVTPDYLQRLRPQPQQMRRRLHVPPHRDPWQEEMQRAHARRDELLSLLALGAAFQLRLSGAVAAAWSPTGSRAHERASAQPALAAALTGRLAPAAAPWLGTDPAQISTSLHEGPGWGSIQLDRAHAGPGAGSVHATLPVSWLARVWAPGLTIVDDHLVIDVQDVSWPRARVLALPQPGAAPVVLSVRGDGGRWYRGAS